MFGIPTISILVCFNGAFATLRFLPFERLSRAPQKIMAITWKHPSTLGKTFDNEMNRKGKWVGVVWVGLDWPVLALPTTSHPGLPRTGPRREKLPLRGLAAPRPIHAVLHPALRPNA